MFFLKSKTFISLFLILACSFLTGAFMVKAGLNTDYVKVEVVSDVDSIAPEITDFKVDGYTNEQDPVYTVTKVNITWTVSDTGGSLLDQIEVWRSPDIDGHPDPDGWIELEPSPIVDNIDAPSHTGSYDDDDILNQPNGAYWYGLHAIDAVGNCIDETGAHCGGVSSDNLDPRAIVGPIQVVIAKDIADPSVIDFYIIHDIPWVNSSNPSIDVFWEVADSGGSHLSHVEIWRAVYNDIGCSDIDKSNCSWGKVNEDYDAPADSDSWESSTSDSPLNDGIWWYGIHVLDNNGNWADEGGPVKVQIDVESPTSRIDSPAPGSWHADDFLVDTLDEDLVSHLDFDSCEYKVISYDSEGFGYTTLDWTYRDCNGPGLEITVNGEDGLCRYESSDVSDYNCYVYVQAYDLAGNEGGSNAGYRIDWTTTTQGKLYVTDTEEEQTYPIQINQGAQYNFKYHVTDNIKVAACDLYIGGVLKQSMDLYPPGCSTDCTASTTFAFDSVGTYYNNFVRCADAAMNIEDSESVIIEVLQGTAPVISSLNYFTAHSSTPDQQCTSQFNCCMEPTAQSDCSVKFNISAYDPNENPLTYTWNFADGTPNSNDEDPSHYYADANTYNVSVDVFNGTEHTYGNLSVTVNSPDVSVGLTANPAFGTDFLEDVDLRGIVGGSMFGTINYKFDCTNNDSWELEVSNQSIDDYTAVDLCDYPIGEYTSKVFVQRGEGDAENTVYINVVNSECSPGQQTTCTSPQGGSHIITCQGDGSWPSCPTDECAMNDVQSCGNGGTQTCLSSLVWGPCVGEGECSPGPDNPDCSCPISSCIGSDYYDYPSFGDCTSSYSCDTGFEAGQPCEPNIIINSPQCDESPICDSLNALPEQGVAPLNVLFTGSAHDNDGTIINYDFIFGDSESETTIDNTINHTYSDPGTYCAKLRVQDDDEVWSQTPGDCPSVCAKQINVEENIPPLADIACNGSDCGLGSACNGSWIAYNRNCQFYFLNESTDSNSTNPPDNNNDIIKSIWSIFYQEGTPWQDPYVICTDNSETPENEGICDLLLPALPVSQDYYVTLMVEDHAGATDDYSKNFYVRREAAADFQCSLNPEEGWQSCNGFVVSEGEIVYFKDISIPSEGSTGISNWSWTFEDGDPATSNDQNPSASFVNITGSSGTVTLDITDDVGRTDTEQYQLQITIPLPQWEEIVPF